MPFEYDDGNVEVVILGGTNKTTGKKNPTDLTGYYLRKDTIDTKFGTKPFYVFKTKNGNKGLIGGGNLNGIMDTKVIGLLTHVIDTGETKDVGKGNPMKIYKVGQDRSEALTPGLESSFGSTSSENDEDDLEGITASYEEPARAAPSSRAPARPPTAEQQARVQAMLKSSRN